MYVLSCGIHNVQVPTVNVDPDLDLLGVLSKRLDQEANLG